MDFKEFLSVFEPKVELKSKQVNQASWILETTGSKDAASLRAELEVELKMLFNDKEVFERLISWDKDPKLKDPLLKRELNVLIRSFKPNLIKKELLEKIAEGEAGLALTYSIFRPQIKGKALSENDIINILKKENNVKLRKEAWEASKQIGKVLAPNILELVSLRNEAAKSLGYDNYFTMQLELQEVDENWLFETLDNLSEKSNNAYSQLIHEINTNASVRFGVSEDSIGPWAWSEPFCQEDPEAVNELDELVEGIDIIETTKQFYHKMSLDVEDTIKRSDNFERPGKNQHAFCINIDRKGDVRTLNNIKPSMRWLETSFHELGHAVYDLGISQELPWLLREPPHMITTEAMALLTGRQAYRSKILKQLLPNSNAALRNKAEESLKKRQLIFSRWVLVMTYFERELYHNPTQDLNKLWWKLVERFQKIKSQGSQSKCDWAAKYHVGLAPVYYFSYLLGELFASSLEEKITQFLSPKTGEFLKEKLFMPGDRMHWNELIKYATGKELTPEAWLKQFT